MQVSRYACLTYRYLHSVHCVYVQCTLIWKDDSHKGKHTPKTYFCCVWKYVCRSILLSWFSLVHVVEFSGLWNKQSLPDNRFWLCLFNLIKKYWLCSPNTMCLYVLGLIIYLYIDFGFVGLGNFKGANSSSNACIWNS